jgi:tRNA 5-methylaminomethyl-2-thiouridine biosynthesis bifunctional protein
VKTAPIVPAQIEPGPDGVPRAPAYDDLYHPRSGALAQAEHVFLAGNGLPARWAGRTNFTILETGFGLGSNFLATWAAWRADPQRCERLHFVSIEAHPLQRADLAGLARDPALRELAAELAAAWPPLVANLHRIDFDGGRMQLSLCFGDVAAWLPELVANVDAVYLDGFAPDRNPQMWQPRLFKAIARLAVPGTTAATWSAARLARDGLAAAGFVVEHAAGRGGKRDITRARYAPRHVVRRAPARSGGPATGERHALVVGAGLAGCATAWALAQQGWSCTLVDRHAGPAAEASGNPAGLFHGIVNPQDGAHARFNRAAALQAAAAVRHAIDDVAAAGRVEGLLRLETGGASAAALQATLDALGLPPDYVQALEPAAASERAGVPLRHPAWFYPGGGWVDPAALARCFLRRAGERASFRGNVQVERIEARNGGWALVDAIGGTLAQAPVLVLANAGDALRLLGSPAWPVEPIRGQLTQLPVGAFTAAAIDLPRLPVAGAGYLLPAHDGQVCFGATNQPGDRDPAVRIGDHRTNLAQLERLLGRSVSIDLRQAGGRTAWRWSSRDRLPVVGAVPLRSAGVAAGSAARLDQPRFVPREPGLFVFTALGSRGITWSALGAQVIAAAVSGAPVPLEADLLDAIDPARYLVRALRRAAS